MSMYGKDVERAHAGLETEDYFDGEEKKTLKELAAWARRVALRGEE